jgi:hypothetical protein
MCVCKCVCVCFDVILISAEIPFKWTLSLKFEQQNLYAHLFYFVCVTSANHVPGIGRR